MTARSHGQRPTDEALLAFADGELPAEETTAIARYLETDEEARAIVEAFRQSGAVAATAYDHVLDAPVPQRLIDAALGKSQAAATAERATNVVPMRRPRNGWPRVSIMLAPLAAAVLLAVGTVAAYRLVADEPAGSFQLVVGPVDTGSAAFKLLEVTPANQPVAVGTSELMVVATFFDRNGRPCREFEITGGGNAGGTSMSAAIGCRNAGGRWSIEGAVHLAGGPSAPIVDFKPASGQSYPAFEGVLKSIGAKPAIAAADEKALIEQRWSN